MCQFWRKYPKFCPEPHNHCHIRYKIKCTTLLERWIYCILDSIQRQGKGLMLWISIKHQVFSVKCHLKQYVLMYQSQKSSYSGEKQANKKPILVQMQSFDSRIWSFWLVVWPHNGSTRRIEMSGAEKSRLEIIPSTYHCYIQGRNPPQCIQKLTTSNNFDVKSLV